jgi:5-methylcytosine-specific restriction endonuclease McrA
MEWSYGPPSLPTLKTLNWWGIFHSMSKTTPCLHPGCTKVCDTTKGGAHGLCCKHNREKHQYTDCVCIDCGKPMRVRKDTLKRRSGRCRPCANKETANRPEVRSAASVRARSQVLRQGGVPNARKITKENRSQFRQFHPKLTVEQRKKKAASLPRGPKHHRWKGGVTKINATIRGSLEYKLWREAVFARDNWTCVVCGTRSAPGVTVYLNADHIKPFSEFPELRFDVDNGRSLCDACHKETPTYGWKQINRLRRKKKQGEES